jgi:5-methylcytosine-specific restriction endonuclease McrA
MFAKTIIDSDAFLDMPLSSQALYFHLSMRGDDDGFINNPRKIQKMVGASDDDLKVLIMKNFIIPFESGVVVIKHWKIHNYIRGDRKKDTVYPEEMSLLTEKDNGAYSLKSEQQPEQIAQPKTDEPKEETARQKAYRESTLPYSFDYKIRNAFVGKTCPVCGFAMKGSIDECGVQSYNRRPTIQHNIPISKGGRHEIENISVICHQCNVTLQDNETGRLNTDEVIEVWDKMSVKCQSNVSQVTDKCQRRLGEDSIREGSIGEEERADAHVHAKAETKHFHGAYNNVKLTDKELDSLYATYGKEDSDEAIDYLSEYIKMKGYKAQSHYLALRKWVFDALKEDRIKKAELEAREKRVQPHTDTHSTFDSDEFLKAAVNRTFGDNY